MKELLPRKVLLSNVPKSSKAKDLQDFFIGAIFSATGHTMPAQLQKENAAPTAEVEFLGGTHAEVIFATPLCATIAVALNGITFKDKPLGIKRPTGFAGKTLNPAKLQSVSLEDLLGFVPEESIKPIVAEETEASAASAVPPPTTVAAKVGTVKLGGIPPSMTSKSVFDLLQQFGGPLKSLNLPVNRETGDHAGSGTADFADYASAVEASRFSPLLGFIEVVLPEGEKTIEQGGWFLESGLDLRDLIEDPD